MGHYSNQVWTKEVGPRAVSGYTLDLYKQDDVMVGSIGTSGSWIEQSARAADNPKRTQ